jgi:hypothetical protein
MWLGELLGYNDALLFHFRLSRSISSMREISGCGFECEVDHW